MNSVTEKFEHYFDKMLPMDLNRVMLAIPTIHHRNTLSIDKLSFFPNRFIFIEQSELELYKSEIDNGWTPVIRTAQGLPETRNQILQHFRKSKFDYLIMADDDLCYLKVTVTDGKFRAIRTDNLEDLFKLELARMERDSIDVLTVPNPQFLTGRITDSVMNDKKAVDYNCIIYNKKALSNNYWYETAPGTCEDQFMAKLLLADPMLRCRWSIILRRETRKNDGTSIFNDNDGHLAWQDKTNDLLEQLSARGFTEDLMNLLWTPEQRPIVRYPLNYKRRKKYIQEKPKWKRFLM